MSIKPEAIALLVSTIPFTALPLHAGPRTSVSYSIATDTADAGGKRTISAAYTNDASVGGVAGLSTVLAPAETTKSGYIGQLYEITGLQLAASPTTVNEGATRQLSAAQLLHDLTTLAVSNGSVAWSVVSGPIASINASGLATASAVYQDTNATAQGTFGGNTGTLQLTVLNVSIDDLGAYAADGIDDAWQVQYFGVPPNANAGPTADVTGTGQNNLFKYIAGLNPVDRTAANAVFALKIAPVPGQPLQRNLIFSPRFTDRTYAVKSKPDLATGTFAPLTNASVPSDNGTERTITDQSATGAKKFYHVEITKP